MWTFRVEQLSGSSQLRFTLEREGRPATFAEVLHGWQTEADFRTLFNAQLAQVPFQAFRWETPAVTSATIEQPFQCVVLDSPGLERPADPAAFAQHFGEPSASVVTFANLGKDALLVVPCSVGKANAYGHLAAFVRQAPATQQDQLWQAVGAAMAQHIGKKPVWLSTAGAGVAWLHVRLDDRPKYYEYEPYRRFGLT